MHHMLAIAPGPPLIAVTQYGCANSTLGTFSEDSGREFLRLKTSSCLERSCARSINETDIVHWWSTDASGD
jgi:hypothetical protein